MNKKILPIIAVIVVVAVLVLAFLPLSKVDNAVSKYFITGEIKDPSFAVSGYNNHTWFTSSLRDYHVNNTSIVVSMNTTWGHKIDTPSNVYLVSMLNTLNYSVNLTITTNYTHGQFFYYDLNNSNTSMVFEKVVRNSTSGVENFSIVNMSTVPLGVGSWYNNTSYYEINTGWIVQSGQQIHVPANATLTISLANYEYSFADGINYTNPAISPSVSPFISNSTNNSTVKYESGVISI